MDVGKLLATILRTLKEIGINTLFLEQATQLVKSVPNFFESRYSFASLGSGESILGIRTKNSETIREQMLPTMQRTLPSFDRRWMSQQQSGETISILDKSDDTKLLKDVLSIGLRGKDFFVVKNSLDFFKSSVIEDSLRDDLEFKLVAEKLRRETVGKQQVLAQFLSVQRFFESLTIDQPSSKSKNDDDQRNAFGINRNDSNSIFRGLAKYIGPLGALLVTDNEDVQYTVFTLRRMAFEDR